MPKRLVISIAFASLTASSSLPLLSQSGKDAVGSKAPSMEVIVVRPENSQHEMNMQFTADGLIADGVSLDTLIRVAYGLDIGQVANEPAWAATQQFRIEGKVAAENVAAWKNLSGDQIRQALQDVLQKEFKLTSHQEQQVSTVLELTTLHEVSPKLSALKVTAADSSLPPMEAYPGTIAFNYASMDALCTVLSSQMRRKVINKTGMDGDFHFKMRYAPDSMAEQKDAEGNNLPSLEMALRDELGLHLIPRKDAVSHLVIDHAEMPQIDLPF